MHLFGNNQHAEGVIKYLKEQPDLKIHTKQPATYFWWWFNNSIKAMRKLVYEYETAACILKRRQWRRLALDLAASGEASGDVLNNEAINQDQVRWDDKGYHGRNGEQRLLSELKKVFDEALNDLMTSGRRRSVRDSVSFRFRTISAFAEKTAQGTMSRFSYVTFIKWYNGTWKRPKSGIPKAAIAAMAAFCTEVSTGSSEFGVAVDRAVQMKITSTNKKKQDKSNK